MNMTPERAAYEQTKARVDHHQAGVAVNVSRAIQMAADIGLIVTIDAVPQLPPAMGNYSLKVEVRPSNELRKMLDQLKTEAEASEHRRDDCAIGLHSWAGSTDVFSPETRCTFCGEPYGEPK